MFCCPKTWLWFRQEGSLEQALKALPVFVGRGLDLEVKLALAEVEQLLGLDREWEMLLILDLWDS